MSMSNSQAARDEQRAARAEAAAWIVRLHGPHRSAELEAAFRDWLGAHPQNGRQFERVTEVWDAGSSVPVPGVPRLTRWKEPPFGRKWSLAAAVFLSVCGLIGWATWRVWTDPTYTTGIGEQRVVRLDDGSRLSLNSGTHVRITYSDSERLVELERGEACFEVAHNPSRPFTVTAGSHRVTALGTTFVVRYETARTAVTLLEGRVAVSPVSDSTPLVPLQQPGDSPVSPPEGLHGAKSASTPGQPTIALPASSSGGEGVGAGMGAGGGRLGQELILSPGERVTFAAGAIPRLDAPNVEAVTAWRRGEVMLDRTALADAIAELNRYDKNTLVIDDPRIASLDISGIYLAGDSGGFARTVAKLYNLEVVEKSNRIYLRAAANR
jgi:transmembrane sensor